jgi:hypothetical protein
MRQVTTRERAAATAIGSARFPRNFQLTMDAQKKQHGTRAAIGRGRKTRRHSRQDGYNQE